MIALLALLHGATAMACAAVALFFVRYWRQTHDRLFMLFAIAFGLLGVNRVALSVVHVEAENVPYLYVLRLLAFAVIAFAVVDKNRST